MPTFPLSTEERASLTAYLVTRRAAARVRALTVQEVSARLNDRFRLLTTGSRGALPRQQTLRALIDWSYDLLAPDEREMLAKLSVFSGGWDLETATAVCGDGLDAAETARIHGSLADKSLLIAPPGTSRYRMLETVRFYGSNKLEESGRREKLRSRRYGTGSHRRAHSRTGPTWAGPPR